MAQDDYQLAIADLQAIQDTSQSQEVIDAASEAIANLEEARDEISSRDFQFEPYSPQR